MNYNIKSGDCSDSIFPYERICVCNTDYCNDERLDQKTIKYELKCVNCGAKNKDCKHTDTTIVKYAPGEVCVNETGVYGKNFNFVHIIYSNFKFCRCTFSLVYVEKNTR